MDELVANFELSEGQEFDALFEIYASGTTWGNIDGNISNQIDLKEALDSKASNTRVDEIVNTYDYEIGNINSDITSINDTLQSYGNIVTHDAADFATSAQGALADTALQPNDNITELVNNAGYITSADLPTLADLTTTAQLNAINSGITTSGVSQITTNTNNIANIENLIPVQATSSNQLADKNFVNSSIATNTANFIGTFNSLAELEAYTGPLTNNDYAFVTTTDAAGNTLYDRYKYNATEEEWLFEYELNNSSFTANQWAAINSGITSGDVALIATAVQPSDLATVATTGAYSDLTGAPTVNNATITLTQGGVSKGTFTLNQSNDATINLDAGGGGAVDSVNGQTGVVVLTANDVGALPNTTVIPTKTSDLTNDSGYVNQTALQDALDEKQDILTAGTDLEIVTSAGGDSTVTGTTSIVLENATDDGLNSVTLTGACEQRDILPSEYQRVEYIESSGTQYIKTGYIPTSDIVEYGIEIYGAPNDNSSLFGAQASLGSPKYTGVPFTSSNTTRVYIGNTSAVASVSIRNNQWNKYVLQTTSSTAGKVTLNGVDTDFTYTNGIMKTLEIYLFANNQSDSATQLSSIQVKSFYIKDNGVLVRNYVPAKNASNVIGLYDLVSSQFFTNQGTGDFTAGADVTTPSPDNVMPIWCNNGAIKVRNKSGLPLEYTLLDYIESTGTQYLNLNRKGNSAHIYKFVFTPTNSTKVAWFGYRKEATVDAGQVLSGTFKANDLGFYSISGSGGVNNCGDTVTWVSNTKYNILLKPSQRYIKINNSEFTNYVGLTTDEFETENNVMLFTNSINGTAGTNKASLRFESMVETDANGNVYTNLIPCKRNSDNEIGMYDTVTGTFFTNQGTGDFIAGNSISDVEIYTDGTVEMVKDELDNTATAEMLLSVGNYKDTQSILNGAVTRNVGIKALNGTEDWEATTGGYYSLLKTYLGTNSTVLPFGSLDIICTHYTVASVQTANKMLVGNSYVNWYVSATFTTLASWKQYLADQYISGTPVIFIYPVTSTTETVTGQILTTVQGNNTLTITQASIENLPISANYDLIGGNIINFTNVSGYTKNIGTVTSVNNVQPDSNGNVSLTIPSTAAWGNITGTLSNQTDLQNALDSKVNTSDFIAYTATEVETLWGSI